MPCAKCRGLFACFGTRVLRVVLPAEAHEACELGCAGRPAGEMRTSDRTFEGPAMRDSPRRKVGSCLDACDAALDPVYAVLEAGLAPRRRPNAASLALL